MGPVGYTGRLVDEGVKPPEELEKLPGVVGLELDGTLAVTGLFGVLEGPAGLVLELDDAELELELGV